jgi:hypothetical protein
MILSLLSHGFDGLAGLKVDLSTQDIRQTISARTPGHASVYSLVQEIVAGFSAGLV